MRDLFSIFLRLLRVLHAQAKAMLNVSKFEIDIIIVLANRWNVLCVPYCVYFNCTKSINGRIP